MEHILYFLAMNCKNNDVNQAASIAGKVLFPEDERIERAMESYNGMAPDAKLAIYDLGVDGDVFKV